MPLLAAVSGSAVGALMQAQSCSVIGASEIRTLVENAQMTGAQKLAFMKDYLELTDRPWGIVRSIISFITFGGSSMLGLYAATGGFGRR
jgi:hypothetical protein